MTAAKKRLAKKAAKVQAKPKRVQPIKVRPPLEETFPESMLEQGMLDNAKHEAFCRRYVLHLNQSRAAREAGYADSAAGNAGWKMAAMPAVRARIKQLQSAMFAVEEMEAAELVARLSRVARANIQTMYDQDGNLLKPHQMSEQDAAGIAGIEVEERLERNELGEVVGQFPVVKVKVRDPVPAMIALAKIRGLITAGDAAVNVQVNFVDRMAAAEARVAARRQVAIGKAA